MRTVPILSLSGRTTRNHWSCLLVGMMSIDFSDFLQYCRYTVGKLCGPNVCLTVIAIESRGDPMLLLLASVQRRVALSSELVNNIPLFLYEAHCPSVSPFSKVDGCVAVLLYDDQRFHYEAASEGILSYF